MHWLESVCPLGFFEASLIFPSNANHLDGMEYFIVREYAAQGLRDLTLANSSEVSATKKKKVYCIDTWSQWYRNIFSLLLTLCQNQLVRATWISIK